MNNVTQRLGAPKHRRGWKATIVTVELEVEGGVVHVPFEVHAGGAVYTRRGSKGGPLRRVRDKRILRLVNTKLAAREKARREKEATANA